MIPTPQSFESAMSALTLAAKVIETSPPQSSDDLDRLRWVVMSLDRAAVKAAGNLKEERVW